MFSYMQDDQGPDLVRKQVDDNLRRAYIGALDEPTAGYDLFDDLLERIRLRQMGARARN